jgi:hypothetical protein
VFGLAAPHRLSNSNSMQRRSRCGDSSATEANGRGPTSIDWVKGDLNRPNSLTMRRHFGTWDRALHLAGLEPYVPSTQSRNYGWSDSEMIQALKDWTAEHGRSPKWHEWLRASPGRPSNPDRVRALR